MHKLALALALGAAAHALGDDCDSGLVAGVNARSGYCLDKIIFELADGTVLEEGLTGGSMRTPSVIDPATEYVCGIKQYASSSSTPLCRVTYMGLGIEFTVCSIATGAPRTISYSGTKTGGKSKLYDSGLVSWPCQIVGFDTHPDDTNPMTLERITGVTTDCEGDKCPPTAEPTAEPTVSPAPCPDILKCSSTEDCPDGDGIIYECEFPSVRRNLRFGGYEKTGCCVAV